MTEYNIIDETRDKFINMIKKTKEREKITHLCVDKNNNITTDKIITIGKYGTDKDPKYTCKKGTRVVGLFHTHPDYNDPNAKRFSYGDLITGLNKDYKLSCLGYGKGNVKCVVRKNDINLKKKLNENLKNYDRINGSSKKVLRGEKSDKSYYEDIKAAKKLMKKEFDYFNLI